MKKLFKWVKYTNDGKFPKPTHARAICFTHKGDILIRKKPKDKWNSPGGHIRKGESPIKALKRELQEEACVKISKAHICGFFINEKESHILYAAVISKVTKMKPDPDTGILNIREFIPQDEFFYYIEFKFYKPWFEEALSWYNSKVSS